MEWAEFQSMIRKNIRRHKEEQRLTIAELSRLTGMSTVTISFILSGRRNITLYSLYTFADAFGINPKELLNNGKDIYRKHRE